MLELGAGADILRALGWLYLGLMALLIVAALWLPKRWWQKVVGVATVLLVFAGPAYFRSLERSQLVDEHKVRYEKAKALFDERCKTAGEKIYRTVDDVESFVWQRWRPEGVNYDDQFALDDPYGKDCSMEGCIYQFLRGLDATEGSKTQAIKGYKAIETIDPRDGVRYEYSGVFKTIRDVPRDEFSQHVVATGYGSEPDGRFLALERSPIKAFSARYGVLWEDVSTHEDRSYWIAGGAIRIIDLQTKEIVAERTGYLMDPGQGSKGGQRSPWTWARSSTKACPSVNGHNLEFIRSVLKHKQGE